MKKYVVIFTILTFCFLSCQNEAMETINDVNIGLDNIIYIGSNYSLPPLEGATYLSSNENVASISQSGKITLHNKGIVTFSMETADGKKEKEVAVYQVVQKPRRIEASEQWGPYEKIVNTTNSITINENIAVVIAPNTMLEKITITLNGKLATENCDKKNAVLREVKIITSNTAELFIDNVTAYGFWINGWSNPSYGDIKEGYLKNSDFLAGYSCEIVLLHSISSSPNFLILGNIFRHLTAIHVEDIPVKNNVLLADLYLHVYNRNNPDALFKHNTIDIFKVIIKDSKAGFGYMLSPDMSLSENYWMTTNTSLIDEMIYDGNDSDAIDYVVPYLPILTQKHPMTPEP
jgi:hypothetical protein